MELHLEPFDVDHGRISKLAISTYLSLPPRGAKPGRLSNNRLEWTVLAAMILSYPSSASSTSSTSTRSREYHLVSLATGLKCLPYTSLPKNGDVLHDQHAEVLTRRGARMWLAQRLQQEVVEAELGGDKLFERVAAGEKKWRLREQVKVHLYVSTLPCGDASSKLLEFQRCAQDVVAAKPDSLTPADLLAMHTQNSPSNNLASSSSFSCSPSALIVRGRASSTHHFTQTSTSATTLRTKPGRPDSPPSICMSCSDKLALWNAPEIGIQGSLLSSLLEPVYIHSVTICDHPTRHIFPAFPLTYSRVEEEQRRQALQSVLAEDCRRALQRARHTHDPHPIIVGWSTTPFPDSRESQLERAWSTFAQEHTSTFSPDNGAIEAHIKACEPASCPNSLLFIRDPTLQSTNGRVENLASGTRMGAPTKRTKSKDGHAFEPLKPPARSALCRLNYFQSFIAAYAAITGTSAKQASLLYTDAKEGAFGQATKVYRNRKAELLGGKQDAQRQVEAFLTRARDATAIQAVAQREQSQETLATRRDGCPENVKPDETASSGFKAWLRTPAAFSQFDVQGRISQAPQDS